MTDPQPVDEDGDPVWTYREGDLLPGGYPAVDRLGVGLRCEAWLVWAPRLWCPAVLKLARPHQVGHERAVRSLRREVAALAGAVHPGLPRLFADGTGDEVPHVLVEYVDGPTLDEELVDGPFDPVEAALVAVQVLAAVADLHARGRAHLDVKPENVVLRDGRPVVIDFGSARELGAPQPPGRPIGTFGYAAPEQEDCLPVSSTMDCYAVGATLYELVTGKPVGQAGPVPASLADVVAGLLEPDPAHRTTVPDALLALARAVPGEHRPWPAWADAHLAGG